MENAKPHNSAQELPPPQEKHLRAPAFWVKYAKFRWIIFAGIAALIIGGIFGVLSNKQQKSSQLPSSSYPSVTSAQSSHEIFEPTAVPRSKFGEIIGKIYWDVPADSLGATGFKTEPLIKDALSSYQYEEIANTHIVVTHAKGSSMSGRFIYAELERRDDNNIHIPSSNLQLFLKRIGTEWDIKSVEDPDFCPMLKTFPEDIVTKQARIIDYKCR